MPYTHNCVSCGDPCDCGAPSPSVMCGDCSICSAPVVSPPENDYDSDFDGDVCNCDACLEARGNQYDDLPVTTVVVDNGAPPQQLEEFEDDGSSEEDE